MDRAVELEKMHLTPEELVLVTDVTQWLGYVPPVEEAILEFPLEYEYFVNHAKAMKNKEKKKAYLRTKRRQIIASSYHRKDKTTPPICLVCTNPDPEFCRNAGTLVWLPNFPDFFGFHEFCMLITPECYCAQDATRLERHFFKLSIESLLGAFKRLITGKSTLDCAYCGFRGAFSGCSMKRCNNVYHLPCALRSSCYISYTEGEHSITCPTHVDFLKSKQRNIIERIFPGGSLKKSDQKVLSGENATLKCSYCKARLRFDGESTWLGRFVITNCDNRILAYHYECMQDYVRSCGYDARCQQCHNLNRVTMFHEHLAQQGVYINDSNDEDDDDCDAFSVSSSDSLEYLSSGEEFLRVTPTHDYYFKRSEYNPLPRKRMKYTIDKINDMDASTSDAVANNIDFEKIKDMPSTSTAALEYHTNTEPESAQQRIPFRELTPNRHTSGEELQASMEQVVVSNQYSADGESPASIEKKSSSTETNKADSSDIPDDLPISQYPSPCAHYNEPLSLPQSDIIDVSSDHDISSDIIIIGVNKTADNSKTNISARTSLSVREVLSNSKQEPLDEYEEQPAEYFESNDIASLSDAVESTHIIDGDRPTTSAAGSGDHDEQALANKDLSNPVKRNIIENNESVMVVSSKASNHVVNGEVVVPSPSMPDTETLGPVSPFVDNSPEIVNDRFSEELNAGARSVETASSAEYANNGSGNKLTTKQAEMRELPTELEANMEYNNHIDSMEQPVPMHSPPDPMLLSSSQKEGTVKNPVCLENTTMEVDTHVERAKVPVSESRRPAHQVIKPIKLVRIATEPAKYAHRIPGSDADSEEDGIISTIFTPKRSRSRPRNSILDKTDEIPISHNGTPGRFYPLSISTPALERKCTVRMLDLMRKSEDICNKNLKPFISNAEKNRLLRCFEKVRSKLLFLLKYKNFHRNISNQVLPDQIQVKSAILTSESAMNLVYKLVRKFSKIEENCKLLRNEPIALDDLKECDVYFQRLELAFVKLLDCEV